MRSIKLGRKIINSTSDPYIIAEIGVNHECSMKQAKQLILNAKNGGADAAKFQTYKAELITSKYSHKIKKGILLDQDFSKPQAFHLLPVTRSGGLAVIISLNIFFIIFNLMYSKILF